MKRRTKAPTPPNAWMLSVSNTFEVLSSTIQAISTAVKSNHDFLMSHYQRTGLKFERVAHVAMFAASLDTPVERVRTADADLLAMASWNRRRVPVDLYRHMREREGE